MHTKANISLEQLAIFLKKRGFIYPSSEIYGGLSAAYDYGPLGVELMRALKESWWNRFVRGKKEVYGLDTAIFMNPKVWQASGHTAHFTDPLVECKSCHMRFRPDKLVEESLRAEKKDPGSLNLKDHAELAKALKTYDTPCPSCGQKNFTDIRDFNNLFETYQGVVRGQEDVIYLRGEIAQGMFVNFKNVEQSMRAKIPFGIAQQGKAFRNEVTVKRFIFRTREFNLMEIEYFVEPEQAKKTLERWKKDMEEWYIHDLGLTKKHLTWREQSLTERAHYSAGTFDMEYAFPWGDDEIGAVANRTDYDLKQHAEHSGKDLAVLDTKTNKKYIPYVIEPTFGIDRTLLALLFDALEIVAGGRNPDGATKHEQEWVLHVPAKLAPVQIAVLPLSKKPELIAPAEAINTELQKWFRTEIDVTQSIGKRYRRQDEIGTPFCITVDFATQNDKKVTVRNRDTMQQERIDIDALTRYFLKNIS